MRPASDVLSRLNWDASCIDANDVVIGYLDRFEGIKEMGFYEWMEVTGRIVGGEPLLHFNSLITISPMISSIQAADDT